MFERMLEKENLPDDSGIRKHLGRKSYDMLNEFREYLEKEFVLKTEIKFPFGNNYGWGYKFSHKTKHLCYAFFEKEAFTVTIQLSGKNLEAVETSHEKLTEKGKELWKNRYPCGDGGWIHYRVLKKSGLDDIRIFVMIKAGK